MSSLNGMMRAGATIARASGSQDANPIPELGYANDL